jgi:hypothetical protein
MIGTRIFNRSRVKPKSNKQDLLDHGVLQGHQELPDYHAQHVGTQMPTVLVTQENTGMRMAYVMQTIAKVLPAPHL